MHTRTLLAQTSKATWDWEAGTEWNHLSVFTSPPPPSFLLFWDLNKDKKRGKIRTLSFPILHSIRTVLQQYILAALEIGPSTFKRVCADDPRKRKILSSSFSPSFCLFSFFPFTLSCLHGRCRCERKKKNLFLELFSWISCQGQIEKVSDAENLFSSLSLPQDSSISSQPSQKKGGKEMAGWNAHSERANTQRSKMQRRKTPTETSSSVPFLFSPPSKRASLSCEEPSS